MTGFINRLRGFVLTFIMIISALALIPGTPANTIFTAGGSEFSSVYIFLFFIISGAVAGRYIARKLKQPEVLGELIVGVIIGTILYQFSLPEMLLLRHQDSIDKAEMVMIDGNETWKSAIAKDTELDLEIKEQLVNILSDPSFPKYDISVKSILLLSNFGVLILLFLVGLESSIEEMLRVGGPSLTTALIGVFLPSLLGFGLSYIVLPEGGLTLHLFIGAALSATSIGITARVFKDLKKLNLPESKIVLGAAVIDDVLGLILLAVVTGMASEGTIEITGVFLIIVKAVIFLAATLYIGTTFLRQQIKVAALIDNKNLRLLFPFALLTFLAWLSEAIGLSGIVGAFAAGLIIKEEYFNEALRDKERSVKELIEPVEAIFAPVFFVLMGIQVDITAFAKPEILGLAMILTFAAIVGKLASGFFVKGMDRMIIGIGMVPRGEVGLIFAGIGKAIGVLDSSLFSSVVIIVILTTIITPPALKWAFERNEMESKGKAV